MIRRAFALAAATTLAGCSFLIDVDEVRRTRDAGGVPLVVADRTAIDFGSTPQGQASPPAIIRLSNNGTEAAGTFTAELSGAGAPAFALPDLAGCQQLAAAASCELALAFAPAAAQAYSATLVITASPGGVVTLLLSGTGVAPGALALTPAVVDFGGVVQAGRGAGVTFTVRNTGATPTGALATALTGVDALQFDVGADGCDGQVLGADETCTLIAAFAPGATGPRRATLTVTGAPGGTAVATLGGVGLAPGTLGISPSSRQLPATPVGTQGTPVLLQVSNGGTAPTGPITLALTGGGGGDFEIVDTDCRGAELQPTTSCTVRVRFAPRSEGLKVGTLVASASPGGNASAALSATAQAPAALAVSPAALDFGTVVTTAPATGVMRVHNAGAVATGIPTVTVTGADAPDFSLGANGCTAALAPDAGCDVEVRFAPTDAGMKVAALVVSATPGGAATAPLSGEAVTPGALTLTPAQFAFGQVVQGERSSARVFTVTNVGGSATTALTAALTGTNADQFATSPDGCTGQVLASMASCSLSVTFAPTAGGSKSASLAVSATTGGTATSALNGAGLLPPSLSVAPQAADLGAAVVGETGSSRVFTVTNGGDVATASALQASLTGAGAAAFTIAGNTCGAATLAGGATCTVTVRFAPGSGALGLQTASLEVRPGTGAGGVATASLNATGLTPAALAFDAQAFGAALVGATVTKTFTLTNTGGGESGLATLSVGGTHAAEFQFLPPSGTDCVSGITRLAGGASCTVRVRWTAAGRGARTATLSATASPGGTADAMLGGTGQQQATLSSAITTASAGATELGVAAAPAVSWVVTNSGDLPTGVPTVAISGAQAAEFTASGCAASVPAGGSCTVTVTFTPLVAGTRAASVQVSASPGASVLLALTGAGRARLAIVKAGSGAGTVTSTPAGLSCGTTCSQLFDLGTVTLQARTTNGSGSVFRGWSGACAAAGSNRDCQVQTDLSKSVTATFDAIDHNLVFVSSVPFASDLGSAQAYDTRCNTLATAAGLNSATNDAYVAWVSSSTSPAPSRLGSARGFERLDGRPFTDQLASVLTSNAVLNALQLDETGAPRAVAVRTGTNPDGTAAAGWETCSDWTSASTTAGYLFGSSHIGPGGWTHNNYLPCATTAHVYCFMKTKTAVYSPPVGTGKRLWLTNTAFSPSTGETPDARCAAQRPAGVSAAVALFGTSTSPAAPRLAPAAVYVRPDGQVVGTGEQLRSGTVQSGPWQQADGTYAGHSVWTGYGSPRPLLDPPPADATCSDWTSNAPTAIGRAGAASVSGPNWFANVNNEPCDAPGHHLICVEP